MELGGLGGAGRRIFGVVIGIVTENKHPEGEYRVKVKFPWIRSTDAGDDEDYFSTWARISTPMAGLGRGFYCLPEPDDEVLVMFGHGDIRQPFVIGSLWNGIDLPPVGDNSADDSTDPMGVNLNIKDACKDNLALDGKNRSRFFKSRSGHLILIDDADEDKDEKIVLKTKRGHVIAMNDTDGKENIAIYDSTGEEYIYIDEKNKKITIETKNGDIDVKCENGEFNLQAKTIVTNASSTHTSTSGGDMKHETDAKMTLKATGNIDANGAKINLNC